MAPASCLAAAAARSGLASVGAPNEDDAPELASLDSVALRDAAAEGTAPEPRAGASGGRFARGKAKRWLGARLETGVCAAAPRCCGVCGRAASAPGPAL